MNNTSLEEFYKKVASVTEGGIDFLLPHGLSTRNGHINVLNVEDLISRYKGGDKRMPYNRKLYYKISLVCGKSIAEYADKVIGIEKNALVYGTPKIPYNWVPQDEVQAGYFCIFTSDFLVSAKTGFVLDELPIFRSGGFPVFEITDKQTEEIKSILKKCTMNYHPITHIRMTCCAIIFWN